MPKQFKIRRVEVTWIDSQGTSGWRPIKRILKDAHNTDLTVNTRGYLLEKNDKFLVVALSLDLANGNASGEMIIPVCSILNIKHDKG